MPTNQYEKGTEVKLSEHFVSTEFDCHCKNKACTSTLIDTDLINKLEELRVKWGQPIHIISGYRCSAHNAKVGGKVGSYHLVGKAADIDTSTLQDVLGLDNIVLDCQVFDGLGVNYKQNFAHVDTRGYRVRFKY
jgi:uncharacterized protein YcbK (DUF882 family)